MLHKGGAVLHKIWWCVFWLGCVSKPLEQGTVEADPPVTDPSADAGSDDGDGDGDGDADEGPPPDTSPPVDTGIGDDDGDDDGDADADGEPDIDCDQDLIQDPEDHCVDQILACDRDRPLLATSKGGRSRWADTEYLSWTCMVPDDPYDGPEAVFLFEHPGTGTVEIQLHAPCAELNLFAIPWPFLSSDDECPSTDTIISLCEGSESSGDDTLTLFENRSKDYLIVVDGPEGERANFTLFAECP
jgi:hypothetical protein